jgi:cobalt-zinc-cadmium efflux system membrane fusion protein
MLLAVALGLPAVAGAHEGEAHGEPTVSTANAGMHVLAATGDVFEVVLKHPEHAEGPKTALRVLVAESDTNAPVSGAQVELTLTGPAVQALTPKMESPGVYVTEAELAPEVELAAVATVTRGDAVDVLALGSVHVEAEHEGEEHGEAAHHEEAHAGGRRWALVGGVALLVAVGAWWVLRRRRGLLAVLLPASFICGLGMGSDALAHEGGHGQPQQQAQPVVPGVAFTVPKETQFLLEVRTQRAAVRPLESRLMAPGKVVPRTDRYAQVSAPVPGRVLASGTAVPLVGQRVKRGQVLAVVQQSLSTSEATGLSTDLIQAEAEASRAQAALEQARRDVARLESLQGVVAEKEVQQARLALSTAEQELARARAARDVLAGARQGQGSARFPLEAPIDGVLVEARATVGEQVDPARPLFTVLDASVVWVEARVYEGDVARVEGASGALVSTPAYEGQHVPARLYHVGQMVDEASRSVRVLFEADNREGRLRPGMFVDVAIGQGGRKDVLAVPVGAVVEEEGRAFVFVHTTPESFEPRPVVLGGRDGEWREVREGLKAGERVVVGGVAALRLARGGR